MGQVLRCLAENHILHGFQLRTGEQLGSLGREILGQLIFNSAGDIDGSCYNISEYSPSSFVGMFGGAGRCASRRDTFLFRPFGCTNSLRLSPLFSL